MQRRQTSGEESNMATEMPKQKGTMNGMTLGRMKICFAIAILGAILVYLCLYMRTPELPFPMSLEMEAIYKEQGPGEAKQRRREDLKQGNEMEIKIKKNNGDVDSSKVKKVEGRQETKVPDQSKKVELKVHVAIVACGDRAPEAINSLKSFAILSKVNLHFHIFAEEELHNEFKKSITAWPRYKDGQIEIEVLPIQFPGGGDFDEWKKLFKPCASQRMFLPVILKNVDSVVYVDTDVLMLRPAEDLWNFFKQFNSTQLAALAPEGEVPATGWYNRFARHPYYGRLGLNSGVMLMNLTRMRNAGWNSDIYPIYKQYRYDITWGDQDILNILFHFKPEMLYVVPCDWNFRPDHCMYGSNCRTALENGAAVVHGNRRVFHNQKQPEFKVIYDAFRDVDFGDGAKTALRRSIEKGMEKYRLTYCGENAYVFSKLL